MCCTKRREDRVVVSNQLTMLSRTRKKNVPPEIVNTARQAVRPRIVSVPASSIVPCPIWRWPKLASYERRSPAANAAFFGAIAFSLGAAGGGDCADNVRATIWPITSASSKRSNMPAQIHIVLPPIAELLRPCRRRGYELLRPPR